MLLEVLVRLSIVLFLMSAVGAYVVVGRDRLRSVRRHYRSRLRSVAPAAIVLAVVLLLIGRVRDVLLHLSWIIGWNATATLYELDGEFVVLIQSHATPALTAYFSFIYVYGYVFLLVFPVLAYFALADPRPLRELLYSYTFNYVLGLVCYTLIIAYGPRNVMPEAVDALLYERWPEYQYLTREVNRHTNVFPSLHASLATTVAVLAYRTRGRYPAWVPTAGVLAASVVVSTMYLGIHWATDVVAGILLAVVSVGLATIVAASDRPEAAFDRALTAAVRLRRAVAARVGD